MVGTAVFCAIVLVLVMESRSNSPTAGIPERIGMILQIVQQDEQPAGVTKAIVGLRPYFLLILMALMNSTRLSLMNAAHADVGGAP
jgi:hypothetical protein